MSDTGDFAATGSAPAEPVSEHDQLIAARAEIAAQQQALAEARAAAIAARTPLPAPDPAAAPADDDGIPVIRARVASDGTPALDVPRRQVMTEAVGQVKEIPVWDPRHESNPPAGSTSESLLVFERGVPVRVAGPTHYHLLADGRTLGGYSGGTHYDDGDKIVRIVGIHEG